MNGTTYLQATLLGALQGFTEFLPMSSSGHLVLPQHLFGLHEPALMFDLFLHIATLAAVLAMYRQDVCALLTAWLSELWHFAFYCWAVGLTTILFAR
jgi:undecaprenyl-diphosphatase